MADPTAVQFVSREDLVARVGAETVVQLFDDDGDGRDDPEPLNTCLADASKLVEARLLFKGFSRPQLAKLAIDATLRRRAVEVALGLAGRRRPEWLDQDGRGRYDRLQAEAEKSIDMIARGELRVPLEAVHGKNSSLIGSRRDALPPFVFSNSKANPRGPGGF